MAPMLLIMPGLQELCGELAPPQSDKLAKVDSLEVSVYGFIMKVRRLD
jgi:hypothetical protein